MVIKLSVFPAAPLAAQGAVVSYDTIKNITYDKKWFDNYINIFETEYPINRFDKVYNWDIQKYGITLFYPPKKHFWDIISSNLDFFISFSFVKNNGLF